MDPSDHLALQDPERSGGVHVQPHAQLSIKCSGSDTVPIASHAALTTAMSLGSDELCDIVP